MNLYYVKAKVSIRVKGISGPFEQVIAWLVNADNIAQAKEKYERKVSETHSHMQFSSIDYEYVEIAGEIK